MDPITVDQFTARLETVCARGSPQGLPSKEADRRIWCFRQKSAIRS
jgi:hypothetical protein